MCGMRFIVDVAIEDFNRYVVILIIMMKLIEMTLLIKIMST